MHTTGRTTTLAFVLLLATACSSSATSPGAASSVSPGPAASEPRSPTPQPTPQPTAEPTATEAPAAADTNVPPAKHGEYLLVRKSIPLPDEEFLSELWLIRPDGTGARKIAEGYTAGALSPPRYNLDGVWSHDGSVVHVIKGCESQLLDVPVAGGPPVATASMTDKDGGFIWSRDDRQIAYWHLTGGDVICDARGATARDLTVMNADGTGKLVVFRLDSGERLNLQSWAGGTFLLIRQNGVWVKIGWAHAPRGTIASLYLPASAVSAKASPDGARIAYLSGGRVYVRLMNGGAAKNLGAGTDFEWSPDSRSLAIVGDQLKVANLGSGVTTNLYMFPSEKPTWSPDSELVAFRRSAGDGGIFYVQATGGTVAYVPDTLTGYDPRWQP